MFILVEGEDPSKEGLPPAVGSTQPDITPQAIEEDESESVMASAQDQREEELQVRLGLFYSGMNIIELALSFRHALFLFCFLAPMRSSRGTCESDRLIYLLINVF